MPCGAWMAWPPRACRSRTASIGSACNSRATRPSAVSCAWSRDPAARSGACKNVNPPSRTPSSSSLVAEWPKKRNDEPAIRPAHLPENDPRAQLSALCRSEPEPDLAHYGNAPPPDRDDRHDLRLPGPPCAFALSRLRRAGWRPARLLAERDLGDGDPILLGPQRWKPRTLRHVAHQPVSDPARDGPRRRLREPDALDRRPADRVDPVWRELFSGWPAPGHRDFRPDHLRPLLPRHAARQPFPLLSARGLAPGRRHAGADLLSQRVLLPCSYPRRVRRRRRLAGPVNARARCDPAAGASRDASVHLVAMGGLGDRRADRRVRLLVAGQPPPPRAQGPPGRPAHFAFVMSEAVAQWRGFKAATWLGWELSSNWTRPLKYVYVSPAHFYVYSPGRGLAQVASAVASAAIVLIVATIALGLPIDPLRVNYPLLLASSALALVAVIGMAMAYGLLLLQARDTHGYGELGASVLYVVSGAIFPISVLPGILATIASVSPLVYWMELIRRSLLGSQAIRMFPALS